MKKGKKVISMLLAMVMLASAFTASFVVLAEEIQQPEAVADLEQRMTDCKIILWTSKTTPEDVAAVQALAAEFKALNELEKDMIAPDAFGNIYNRLYLYENYINKDPASLERSEAMTKKVEEQFGAHAAREEAKVLGRLYHQQFTYTTAGGQEAKAKLASFNFSNTDTATATMKNDLAAFQTAVDVFSEQYAAASSVMRGYLAIYRPGTVAEVERFGTFSSSNEAFAILTQFNACLAAAKAEPFSQENPGGSDKEALANWNTAKAEWYYQFLISGMKETVKLAPEYEKAVNLVLTLRDAFDTFIKTDRLDKVKDALSLYDGMNRWYQYLVSKAWSFKFYTYVVKSGSSIYATNINANGIYQKCVDTGLTSLIQDLTDLVNAKDLNNITNQDVAEVQAIYNKIPVDLRSKIAPEVLEKYNAIVALYVPAAPLEPSTEQPELYQPATVTYPQGVTKERTAQAVDVMQTMLMGLLNNIDAVKQAGSLENLMKTGVYTNASVGTALKTIYELLATVEGIPFNLLKISPQSVAGNLTEEKFAPAVEKLLAAANSNTVGGWADLTFADGDWSFMDGDQEGWLCAVVAGLRPVISLIDSAPMVGSILKFANYRASNGDYHYGAYEDLIPILEGLGLNGVMSSAEYSALYDNAATQGEKMDNLLLPILRPVFGLVNDLVAAPLDTLLELLPRLAMLVNDGTLHAQVNKVLGKLNGIVTGALGFSSIDLNGDALNTMLGGLLSDITIVPEVKDEFDNVTQQAVTLSLTLTPIDWELLSHCGSFFVADSVSAPNAYRVGMQPDTTDAFVVTFRYLFSNLMQADNFDSLSATLQALLDESAFRTISSVLALLQGSNADEAMTLIVDLLAPAEPKVDDPKEPEKPTEPGTNQPTGTPENPDNVNTGDPAIAAVAVCGLLAGTALLLLKKRKH